MQNELESALRIYEATIAQSGTHYYSLDSYDEKKSSAIINIAKLEVELKILHELKKLNSKKSND